MKKYVILADVTCDISEEIRQSFGVEEYIPGYVTVDGKEMQTLLDWSLISREEFFRNLSNKNVKVTSAPPNLAEYCEIFSKYVKEG
ncbi:MAG: DegV family protein, partial [Clostridia bacterium]|nr:DegV family protein [Clostridia bacterium]